MRRKRRSGARGGEIAEVLVSCGFPRVRGIRFTVAFRETITIAAVPCPGRCAAAISACPRVCDALWRRAAEPDSASQVSSVLRWVPALRCIARALPRVRDTERPRRGAGENLNVEDFGSSERFASSAAALKNEGVGEHVRTRFHLGLDTTRASIPPVKLRIMRSAPNEENLFLLPDRFSRERTPSKERSSRLT